MPAFMTAKVAVDPGVSAMLDWAKPRGLVSEHWTKPNRMRWRKRRYVGKCARRSRVEWRAIELRWIGRHDVYSS